jgi:hypothetical protein
VLYHKTLKSDNTYLYRLILNFTLVSVIQALGFTCANKTDPHYT